MKFEIPSRAHTILNGDNGNTTLTVLYSHKVPVTWLVQALMRKQRYTYPAIKFSLAEYNSWSITNLIR